MNHTTGGVGDKKLVYSMIITEPDDEPADIAFSNLYPAITECFVIILCG